jgi:hypothetical protein
LAFTGLALPFTGLILGLDRARVSWTASRCSTCALNRDDAMHTTTHTRQDKPIQPMMNASMKVVVMVPPVEPYKFGSLYHNRFQTKVS